MVLFDFGLPVRPIPSKFKPHKKQGEFNLVNIRILVTRRTVNLFDGLVSLFGLAHIRCSPRFVFPHRISSSNTNISIQSFLTSSIPLSLRQHITTVYA